MNREAEETGREGRKGGHGEWKSERRREQARKRGRSGWRARAVRRGMEKEE